MILLSSCQALNEFEQLGFMGWLELGSDTSAPSTLPTTEEVPSAVPSSVPETTSGSPDTEDILTALPTVPTSPTMAEILEALEKKDLKGSTAMISYTGSPSMFTGIEAGNIMEIFKGIEKKYNADSTLFNERSKEKLEELLASGEYFADLILVPLKDAVKYSEEGWLLPINTENLSLENNGAYYVSAAEPYSQDGAPYFLIPSTSTPYESSIVIYCNTDLLARGTGEEGIVSFTKNGKWDLELFCKYIRLAEDKLTEEYIICDTVLSQDTLTSLLCGGLQEGDTLEMAKYALNSFRYSDKSTALRDFFEGNSLFYIGHTSDLREFRESGDSYALLPIPKKDKTEEDYTLYYDDSEVYVFAVPSASANYESALTIIDALAVCGRFELRYNFVESMYTYYIRQRDSIPYTGVSRYDGIIPGSEGLKEAPDTEVPDTTEAPNTTEEPNGDI